MAKDIHGGNIWEAAIEAAVLPEKIIDFSASINPLSSVKVYAAIKSGLRHIPAYPDPKARALRAVLASYHGIDPAETYPGNGSTEFIHLLPRVFKPGRALIVEPAFSEYRAGLDKVGCKAAGLILRADAGFTLDLARLDSRLKDGFDIVYIANPANPTGVLTPKDVLLEAARICKKRRAQLIVDEAFMDFCEQASIKREAVRNKRVMVLRSMTKFWSMAGMRLGYIVGHRDVIKRVATEMPPWSVNTLASCAAAAGLTDAAFSVKTMRWLERERKFLFTGLGAISGLKPFASSVNFLLVKITDPAHTAPALRAALNEAGMLIRDLSAFRGLGKRYFRVAVKTRAENAALLAALRLEVRS